MAMFIVLGKLWLTVVQVDEGIEREARAWLRRHDERVYSFVEATSFVVMRRERLGEDEGAAMAVGWWVSLNQVPGRAGTRRQVPGSSRSEVTRTIWS